VESHLRRIREAGRPWAEARAELEAWLGRQPPADTAGILVDGRLAGRRIPPRREAERRDREFEGSSSGRWSYELLGSGLDSLEITLTEELDFYRALGVGPRSSRRNVRFRDGRIVEMGASDWTQAGRPYDGTRDGFAGWLARERPEAARRLVGEDGLVFDGRTARELGALAAEWRAAKPCTLYHPSYSPREPRIVFSSNCEGRWSLYVMDADGARPGRLTDGSAQARRPAWSPTAPTSSTVRRGRARRRAIR
jgi:hypothetical protein